MRIEEKSIEQQINPYFASTVSFLRNNKNRVTLIPSKAQEFQFAKSTKSFFSILRELVGTVTSVRFLSHLGTDKPISDAKKKKKKKKT